MRSPWITSGIKRSSKYNQRLYEKSLKSPNKQNEIEYKSYKHLFESIKKRSKKLQFSKLILVLDLIAENINKCFSEIRPKFGASIEVSSINFKSYIQKYDTIQSERDLTVNKLKAAFFSLKINKCFGYDGINFNVVKTCLGSLIKPLMHIINSSLAPEYCLMTLLGGLQFLQLMMAKN